LQYAGQGVAMVNATASVQAVADQVSELDNEHDGVLKMIQKLVLS